MALDSFWATARGPPGLPRASPPLNALKATAEPQALGAGTTKGTPEDVGDALLLEHVPRAPRLVQLLGRGDGQPHGAREQVHRARRGPRRSVQREPDEHREEHQGAADVHPVEAHDVARRRGPVHAQPARHDELEVQHEEDHADHVVGVHLRHRERREVADVLPVLRGLACGKLRGK